MSLNISSRRALAAAASAFRPVTHHQRRTFKFRDLIPGWGHAATKEVMRAAESRRSEEAKKADAQSFQRQLATPKLGKQSIFDEKDEVEATSAQLVKGMTSSGGDGGGDGGVEATGALKTYQAMARSIDPDPRSRMRWQRKMVTRSVARALNPYDGESKAERLARTERTMTYRGPLWHLSIKKHVKLAHQIAGRTVDDAMVQMRFSKKKFARDIGVTLDAARDEAAVVAGMGLKDPVRPKGEKIQLKNGQWIVVNDPNKLYIEQAWVNKGRKVLSGFTYPARRGHRPLWGQTTNLNLVLKEQRTLVREYKERKAKEDKRKPWVHLPNRPVTAQRQYYSW